LVYDGFWADGLEGSPDNMNATKVQISAAASRPAAALNGVVHLATDTGVISEDNGATWDTRGYIDLVGPAAAISHIKTGSYTGDGATSQAITGVGFAPKFLFISLRLTSESSQAAQAVLFTGTTIVDDSANGGAIGLPVPTFLENAVLSLDADGFTVDDNGTDRNPNTSTIVYNYVALG